MKRLTAALEIDDEAAGKLADRHPGGNVDVVNGNATELGYPDGSFDSVGCFTMLHHVPTLALQNKTLAEAFRVLRPGGVLIGSDSLASNDLHHFHSGDTYNPIDPAGLLGRLQTLGFDKITIMMDGILKFVASKPGAPGAGGGLSKAQVAASGRSTATTPSTVPPRPLSPSRPPAITAPGTASATPRTLPRSSAGWSALRRAGSPGRPYAPTARCSEPRDRP